MVTQPQEKHTPTEGERNAFQSGHSAGALTQLDVIRQKVDEIAGTERPEGINISTWSKAIRPILALHAYLNDEKPWHEAANKVGIDLAVWEGRKGQLPRGFLR